MIGAVEVLGGTLKYNVTNLDASIDVCNGFLKILVNTEYAQQK